MSNSVSMTVEQAELRADLAKLDLIEAKARETFGDERLNILDVAAIYELAEKCGVLRRHAYMRLKELGYLSYQCSSAPSDTSESAGVAGEVGR